MLKKAIADRQDQRIFRIYAGQAIAVPKMTYKSEGLMDVSHTDQAEDRTAVVKTEGVLQRCRIKQQQMDIDLRQFKLDTVQISATEGAGSVGEGKTESQQANGYVLV